MTQVNKWREENERVWQLLGEGRHPIPDTSHTFQEGNSLIQRPKQRQVPHKKGGRCKSEPGQNNIVWV